MGTNYYLKPKIKTKNPVVLEILDNAKLHIGKSSGGWRFLFQEQTLESYMVIDTFEKWKGLIELDDFYIEDEYGNEVNKDTFFSIVESKQNQMSNCEYDPQTYGNNYDVFIKSAKNTYISDDWYDFYKNDFC